MQEKRIPAEGAGEEVSKRRRTAAASEDAAARKILDYEICLTLNRTHCNTLYDVLGKD